MAISRVAAVKKFRRQLLRLGHDQVSTWSDRHLKNAIFKNSVSWLELLRWILGELDEEIRDCLTNCTEEERISRVKESILVLGLTSAENADSCVKGRVVFKEREELVSQLIELVKVKKSLDAGEPRTVDTEVEEVESKDLQNREASGSSKLKSIDDPQILTGKELFELLVAKHPEYRKMMLVAAEEARNVRRELEEEDGITELKTDLHVRLENQQEHSKCCCQQRGNLPDLNALSDLVISEESVTNSEEKEDESAKRPVVADHHNSESYTFNVGAIPKIKKQPTVPSEQAKSEKEESCDGSSKEGSALPQPLSTLMWTNRSTACDREATPVDETVEEPKTPGSSMYVETGHELVNDGGCVPTGKIK